MEHYYTDDNGVIRVKRKAPKGKYRVFSQHKIFPDENYDGDYITIESAEKKVAQLRGPNYFASVSDENGDVVIHYTYW